MIAMKRLTIVIGAVSWILLSGGTQAQIIPPGGSLFNPPLPQPPPGPKIEVPAVPKMDAPPRQSYQLAPHPSFSDRITTCLEEGAAAGLGPSDREVYSRACANSR
jgi:hypothetical protein